MEVKHTTGDLKGGWADQWTLRIRVSVVCIQCEQTEGGEKRCVEPNKYTGPKGRGWGTTSQGGHVFGRNQNRDTD